MKNQNLRDHMTDLELIFSMLGEASTTAIVKTKNPTGFKQNKVVAKQGGTLAGDARKALDLKTGKKLVSEENYLLEAKKNKELYCKWDKFSHPLSLKFQGPNSNWDVDSVLVLEIRDFGLGTFFNA